jgi:UDP-2,3-diacylglucosamine pyrophosphatase LpxH
MKVERYGRNVHRLTFELAANEEQEFLLISDLHIDNPHCRRDLLKRDLDEAKKRGAKVIINGDFFCIMQGKADPRHSKKDIRPEHVGANYFQLVRDEAIEFMKPYAHIIALIGYGNHETAVLKRQEFDLLADFVTLLNERTGANVQLGGYAGWIVINAKRKNNTSGAVIKMKYHHGYGGGGPATKGVIQNHREMAGVHGADVVWMGHVHELYHIVDMAESLRSTMGDYKVVHRPVHQIRTSTYKDEFDDGAGGFHIEKGRKPKPLGGFWMSLKLDRNKSTTEDKILAVVDFRKTDTYYHQ